ncbi:hypothetical protein LINPERPRIM_LOCUS20451 [Linum perenne]
MMNMWMALPMWGRPVKDEQEGNPKTHDMAIPVLVGGGDRCSVEFRGVAVWSCEVKTSGLLWNDHCFGFMFS